MERASPSRRGFSLVEILVAVILMSIALIVAGTAFTAATATQRKVRTLSIAQNVAQSKLGHVRSMGWANLPWGTTVETVSSLDSGYMTTVVSEPQDSLALITVQIYWGGTKKGKPARGEPVDPYRLGHVRYVTYLSEP